MATAFVETKSKGGRSGANHARYIAAEGRYADKSECVYTEDFNIHKDAINAVAHFSAADKNEAQSRSGKARSYRDLLIALPHELKTKEAAIEYSRGIANEICGTEHAGRLGVHLLDGNWHLHLMFSERKTRNDLPLAENFARGKNNKVRDFVTEQWLEGVKDRNLQKLLRLCPNFKRSNRGEEKIGPKLKNAGASYEKNRSEREDRVHKLRAEETALSVVNAQIEAFRVKPTTSGGTVEGFQVERKSTSALNEIKSRPVSTPPAPPVFSAKFKAGIEKALERSKKPHNNTAPANSIQRAANASRARAEAELNRALSASDHAMAEAAASTAAMDAWTEEQARKRKFGM